VGRGGEGGCAFGEHLPRQHEGMPVTLVNIHMPRQHKGVPVTLVSVYV
jgi:hypothetical protein